MSNLKLVDIEDAIIAALTNATKTPGALVGVKKIATYGESISVALDDYLKSNIAQFPMVLTILGPGNIDGEQDFGDHNYQEKIAAGVVVADQHLGSEQFARRGMSVHGTFGTYNLIDAVRDVLHNALISADGGYQWLMKYRGFSPVMNGEGLSAYVVNFDFTIDRTG